MNKLITPWHNVTGSGRRVKMNVVTKLDPDRIKPIQQPQRKPISLARVSICDGR